MNLFVPNEHFLFVCNIPEDDLRLFREWSWEYNVAISKRVFAQVFSRDDSEMEMRVLLTLDHDMLFLSTSMSGRIFEVAMYLPADKTYNAEEAVCWLMERGVAESKARRVVGTATCDIARLLYLYAQAKDWHITWPGL